MAHMQHAHRAYATGVSNTTQLRSFNEQFAYESTNRREDLFIVLGASQIHCFKLGVIHFFKLGAQGVYHLLNPLHLQHLTVQFPLSQYQHLKNLQDDYF